jgi:hypothetical protein
MQNVSLTRHFYSYDPSLNGLKRNTACGFHSKTSFHLQLIDGNKYVYDINTYTGVQLCTATTGKLKVDAHLPHKPSDVKTEPRKPKEAPNYAMLLQHIHYTSNLSDRLISGEPPMSIYQKMEDLEKLLYQVDEHPLMTRTREKL